MTTTNQIFPPGPNASEDEIIRWREDISNVQSGVVSGDIPVGSGGDIDPLTGKPVDVWGAPPAPATFSATATVSSVILEWTVPVADYVQYTEVFRGTVDNIDDAGTDLVTTLENGQNSVVATRLFTDNPPDPAVGAEYFYWIRFLNSAGTAGPLYQQAGVSAILPKDPTYALEQLAESIGYGEFDVANGVFPVRLVDVLPTLPDSDWPAGSSAYLSTNGLLYSTDDGLVFTSSTDVALSNLDTNGVNIMHPRYSIFNEGTTPPPNFPKTGGDTVVEMGVDGVYGTNSFKVKSTTGVQAFAYLGATDTDYNIVLEPGKKWLVSSMVNGAAASMVGQLVLLDSNVDFSFIDFTTSATPNTWTRVWGVLDMSHSTSTQAILRVDNDSNIADTFMKWEAIMMEEIIGTKTLPNPSAIYSQIAVGAILAEHVGANEIIANSANIKDAVIVEAKIGNLAVTEAKIGNLAVTNAKIGALAVDTAQINNLAVVTSRINTAAIVNAKIANLAVTEAKIDNLAVATAKIQDLAVGTLQLGSLAVTEAKIGNAAVDTLQIKGNAVTVPDSDENIFLEKTQFNSYPAGSPIGTTKITHSWFDVASVTINPGIGNDIQVFANDGPTTTDHAAIESRIQDVGSASAYWQTNHYYFRTVFNGVAISSWLSGESPVMQASGGFSSFVDFDVPGGLDMGLLTAISGNNTFKIQCQVVGELQRNDAGTQSGDSNIKLYCGQILMMGVKR